MAFTTGATLSTLATALVSAGMAQDAANNAAATLSWCSADTCAIPYPGFLVKVTARMAAGSAPAFSYDATPA